MNAPFVAAPAGILTSSRLFFSVFASVNAVALLSGCGNVASGVGAASTPSFSGPWAAEFQDAYDRAPDEFTRNALEDGVVSELENTETVDRFFECVSAHGHEITEYRADGSFDYRVAPSSGSGDPSTADLDRAHADISECDEESGTSTVGMLFVWTHRNPEKLDENTIMAACLVRTGVVPSDYSGVDFQQANSGERPPFSETKAEQEAFAQCQADPLNHAK